MFISRFWLVPSLFWISQPADWFSSLPVHRGNDRGVLRTLSIARPLMLFLAWFFYLSFVVAGQEFLSFQWDALLLEAGFVSIFLTSWKWLPGISPEWARQSRCALVIALVALSADVSLRPGQNHLGLPNLGHVAGAEISLHDAADPDVDELVHRSSPGVVSADLAGIYVAGGNRHAVFHFRPPQIPHPARSTSSFGSSS